MTGTYVAPEVRANMFLDAFMERARVVLSTRESLLWGFSRRAVVAHQLAQVDPYSHERRWLVPVSASNSEG